MIRELDESCRCWQIVRATGLYTCFVDILTGLQYKKLDRKECAQHVSTERLYYVETGHMEDVWLATCNYYFFSSLKPRTDDHSPSAKAWNVPQRNMRGNRWTRHGMLLKEPESNDHVQQSQSRFYKDVVVVRWMIKLELKQHMSIWLQVFKFEPVTADFPCENLTGSARSIVSSSIATVLLKAEIKNQGWMNILWSPQRVLLFCDLLNLNRHHPSDLTNRPSQHNQIQQYGTGQ